MTVRKKPGFSEALESCRPVLSAKPNILKTLLVVLSALVSPTVMIDEVLRGRVTPSDVPSLLEAYK